MALEEDLYSLDHTLAKLILPLLIEFRNNCAGSYPAYMDNAEEWLQIIDKMIAAFELAANENVYFSMGPKECEILQEGISLFAEHYTSLWI